MNWKKNITSINKSYPYVLDLNFLAYELDCSYSGYFISSAVSAW